MTAVPVPAPRRPILVASNILVDERGQVLMGLRKDCNLWEFPGGKVEAESVVDAARREMREETGVELVGKPTTLGYTDGWLWSGEAGRQWYVCIMLLWREWSGFPRLVEGKHHCWQWFDWSELPPVAQMTQGNRQFVNEILPGCWDTVFKQERSC